MLRIFRLRTGEDAVHDDTEPISAAIIALRFLGSSRAVPGQRHPPPRRSRGALANLLDPDFCPLQAIVFIRVFMGVRPNAAIGVAAPRKFPACNGFGVVRAFPTPDGTIDLLPRGTQNLSATHRAANRSIAPGGSRGVGRQRSRPLLPLPAKPANCFNDWNSIQRRLFTIVDLIAPV